MLLVYELAKWAWANLNNTINTLCTYVQLFLLHCTTPAASLTLVNVSLLFHFNFQMIQPDTTQTTVYLVQALGVKKIVKQRNVKLNSRSSIFLIHLFIIKIVFLMSILQQT
jgi:hypothetical protein